MNPFAAPDSSEDNKEWSVFPTLYQPDESTKASTLLKVFLKIFNLTVKAESQCPVSYPLPVQHPIILGQCELSGVSQSPDHPLC